MMYKKKGFKNRRYAKTPYNKGGSIDTKSFVKGVHGSGNSRGGWRRKNRGRRQERIPRSMYVSNAFDEKNTAVYISKKSFKDFNLYDTLVKNILNRGYTRPTKVQDQAIPEILKGRDVLGIGSTGSGKTGAFLIPMIDKVLRNKDEMVLIITPTRELASQINDEFKKFAKDTNLKMVLVIGGTNIRSQIRLLRFNPQFIVATPGRLIDLEKRRCINLCKFNNVVLDEVDQMLAMGFIEDIKVITSKLASRRQSMFFSATVARKEEMLANTLLKSPIKVEAGKQSPLRSIHRDIVKVSSKDNKMYVLHDLLKKREFNKVLVFSNTKVGADKISFELRKRGLRVESIHGDKPQHKRSKVLAKFKYHEIDVLVATDVAARGIDIPDITHVINYDEPPNYCDYIHRIGRTGRIGKKGTALTFVMSKF